MPCASMIMMKPPMSRIPFTPLALGLLLAWTLPARAAAPLAGVPVTLAQNGPNIVLANGIVTATVNTASAGVTSLRYAGHEMVSTAGRHTRVYFSMSGGQGL